MRKIPRSSTTTIIQRNTIVMDMHKAVEEIQELIEKAKGPELLSNKRRLSYNDNGIFELQTKYTFERIFGPESSYFKDFENSGTLPDYYDSDKYQIDQKCRKELEGKIIFFQMLIEELKKPAPYSGKTVNAYSEASLEVTQSSNRVFVVHGRNHTIRDHVVDFLKKTGFEPVVIEDQPNQGQTLIEKIERNSDVNYALVLLTGDDEGRLKGSGEEPKPRPRQNVVLELGLLVGKLTRKRVCILLEDDLEIPSDFHGVAYVPLSGDKWKSRLLKELQAANLTAATK